MGWLAMSNNRTKGDVTPKQFAIASVFSRSPKTFKTLSPGNRNLRNSHIFNHFQNPLNQLKI
jgi:hypothetical protein